MKYIKLFIRQCKFSIMSAAMYRVNFWLMLIQSLINSFMSILCIEFIYSSVESIAGWNKNEMIILICTSQIVNQIYRGVIHWNQNRFVASVGDGSFDRMLLRPVSVFFQANTGLVDISGILSLVGPLIILLIQIVRLNVKIDLLQIVLYVLFLFNGVIILSSFMFLLYSFAFLFIKVDGLTNIYYFIMDIADKPKEMFSREFLFGFIFIIPAIPLANAPASLLLGKDNLSFIFFCLFTGLILPIAAYLSLRAGRKRYTSASS